MFIKERKLTIKLNCPACLREYHYQKATKINNMQIYTK